MIHLFPTVIILPAFKPIYTNLMKEETSTHHFTETYNCDCQLTFPSYHHLSAHNLQTHQRKIKSLQALFSIRQCKYKISAFEPSLELHLPSLKDTL